MLIIISWIGLSKTPATNKPKLLELALEKAYRMVYNEMPIRLLAFNTDGANIRLVERPEIWQNVSRQIEQAFEHDANIIARFADKTDLEGLTEEDERIFYDLPYRHTQFATLSHTWLQTTPEVTYGNWLLRTYDELSAGYAKLVNFCRITATEHGMNLGWMDTICINKDSSSELDESIRSMYKWYRRSCPCIIYLADTTSLEHMHDDRWFTRGWTLQEFIAPGHIKFYTSDWKKLSEGPSFINDKENTEIWDEISKATTIVKSELDRGHMVVPLSRRMQWAASRRVTREEDTSYSLMGIFDVSIATAYGEGAERAFVRLVREILNIGSPGIQDITNWGWGPISSPEDRFMGPPRVSTLLPRGPRAYSWRAEGDVKWLMPYRPITMTHLGLHVPVLLMPARKIRIKEEHTEPGIFDARGDYIATAFSELREISNRTATYTGLIRYEYRICDRTIFDDDSSASSSTLQRGFDVAFLGVLNVVDEPGYAQLPPNGLCFTVDLGSRRGPISATSFGSGESWKVAPSTHPITFDIRYLGKDITRNPVLISESDFHRHGMALRTLYL